MLFGNAVVFSWFRTKSAVVPSIACSLATRSSWSEDSLLRCFIKIMSHTILLVQPGARPETRTYSDYETLEECMEGICKIFEEHLKRTNPHTPSITYDISQLFDFIDELTDLSCLVSTKSKVYAPHNKEWIKEQIYIMLRKQAGK